MTFRARASTRPALSDEYPRLRECNVQRLQVATSPWLAHLGRKAPSTLVAARIWEARPAEIRLPTGFKHAELMPSCIGVLDQPKQRGIGVEQGSDPHSGGFVSGRLDARPADSGLRNAGVPALTVEGVQVVKAEA